MTTSPTTSGELAKPQSGTSPAGVGRRVARPHDGAVAGVERVQDPGRAERVDATVAEGRRRRADRRRHSTPRTGPRRGVSTPARRWPACSRRRPRRRRAAPGCRRDRRGPRTTTSPVRSAGATARPAATRPSRSRSARRGRRRRARARESRATRLPSSLLPERRRCRGSLRTGPRARLGSFHCRRSRRRSRVAVGRSGTGGSTGVGGGGAGRRRRRRPGPGAVPRESPSTASGGPDPPRR